jgi:hypothetical protein
MAIDPELKEMLDKVEFVKSSSRFQSVEIVLLAKFESVLNRRKSTRPSRLQAFPRAWKPLSSKFE